jgi:hypothetical protein
MNCDNDDAGDSDTRQQLTNWLDAKKAEKARNVNRPTLSDRLSKELDSYLAEPTKKKPAIHCLGGVHISRSIRQLLP